MKARGKKRREINIVACKHQKNLTNSGVTREVLLYRARQHHRSVVCHYRYSRNDNRALSSHSIVIGALASSGALSIITHAAWRVRRYLLLAGNVLAHRA